MLVEVSGYGRDDKGVSIFADHSFHIATWIVPAREDHGHWLIDTSSKFWEPTIHAWMPLPKHYEKSENDEPDMMEHAMFEDDPEWLYKDDAVYEQMTLEEVFGL